MAVASGHAHYTHMAATLPSRRPPHHKSVSPPQVAQYDPYAHQLGSLSESVHRLLTERECAIYDRGLTDYHRRRQIRAFVECLSHVLNTNQKRQLLIPIRDSYIKPSDLQKFNQLALEYGLATPFKKRKSDTKDAVRKIEIKRSVDGEWGFNIRGGSEHGIGIFVSSVERGSNAEKSGLKAGDQIKKANNLNCESVTHQEAVSMMRNSKKLQLWVLSRGHIPTSRMAHKVYNWVDPQGRPASPPPDPFEIQELTCSSSSALMNQPDERKVTMMIETGQELGVSIRGGAEHGLGIYISAVEQGSVAGAYGVNVGDQILEVNGISFLGIVHSDAAHALRAQPCMVMKLKDVGKLPHSRVTTLGKTQWYSTGQESGSRTLPHKRSHTPVFTPGYGTQVMLTDQKNSFQVRGMMNEVARSVLTSQELNTFNYYIDQYDQNSLSVDDLVTPMLHILTTPEKMQLLSEMHVVIKPRDLQRFNELTVHKALAVKKAGMYHRHQGDSSEGSLAMGSLSPSFKQHSTPKSKEPVKRYVVAQVHTEEPSHFQINPYESEDHTLTHDSSSEDSGRDKIPQKLSPTYPTFHAPPPPSSAPTGSSQTTAKGNTRDDTWSAAWNETSMMSPPPKGGSADEDSPINISEIEDRIRSETEARLRHQFEEQQQKLISEQQQRLKREQAELEEKVRREAEESMKRQLREKEEALARMTHKHQDGDEDKARLEEEIKRDLEEKIWKEAEEHLRIELQKKMEREMEAAKSNREDLDSDVKHKVDEEQIRREMEQKYKREYEEKMRREQDKWKRREEEERRKQEQEAKARRDAEISRLEAEEQAKIELEERIRREAEASARAEYEARLQHETEERARLAEEVKARKAMEERMEKERKEREKEERQRELQRERVHAERERDQARKNRERELPKNAAAKDSEPVRDAAEEEEDDYSDEEDEPLPQDMTPEERQEQQMLEMQRRRRKQEQKEEEQREVAIQKALAAEKAKKDMESAKQKELVLKREANIRKMEEARKKKESEAQQRREEVRKKKQQQDMEVKQNTIERERQLQVKKKQEEEVKRQKDRAVAERIQKQKEEQEQHHKAQVNRLTKMGGKQVMVSGDTKTGAVPAKNQTQPPKSKAAAVEEERRKAEEMLERKLQEKRKVAAAKVNATEPTTSESAFPSFSYAGYDDLRGELKHVLVTKVVRKLGIAIDGGANTKQKAVIIREISPEGCAGQTAPDLKVNQQILEIEGQPLHGLKHKDVVMCIKHAFEGELGKVIDFTVLEPHDN